MMSSWFCLRMREAEGLFAEGWAAYQADADSAEAERLIRLAFRTASAGRGGRVFLYVRMVDLRRRIRHDYYLPKLRSLLASVREEEEAGRGLPTPEIEEAGSLVEDVDGAGEVEEDYAHLRAEVFRYHQLVVRLRVEVKRAKGPHTEPARMLAGDEVSAREYARLRGLKDRLRSFEQLVDCAMERGPAGLHEALGALEALQREFPDDSVGAACRVGDWLERRAADLLAKENARAIEALVAAAPPAFADPQARPNLAQAFEETFARRQERAQRLLDEGYPAQALESLILLPDAYVLSNPRVGGLRSAGQAWAEGQREAQAGRWRAAVTLLSQAAEQLKCNDRLDSARAMATAALAAQTETETIDPQVCSRRPNRFTATIRVAGTEVRRLHVNMQQIVVIGGEPESGVPEPDREYRVDLPLAGVPPLLAEIKVDWLAKPAPQCVLFPYPRRCEVEALAGARWVDGLPGPPRSGAGRDVGCWIADPDARFRLDTDWTLRYLGRVEEATPSEALRFEVESARGRRRTTLLVLRGSRTSGTPSMPRIKVGHETQPESMVSIPGPQPGLADARHAIWPFALRFDPVAGEVHVEGGAFGPAMYVDDHGTPRFDAPLPCGREVRIVVAHRELPHYVGVCRLRLEMR